MVSGRQKRKRNYLLLEKKKKKDENFCVRFKETFLVFFLRGNIIIISYLEREKANVRE